MDLVERLNTAIKYIEEHLTDTIEYEELAKLLCCSTYHFQRMFAFMNGVPLSEYIRRRKLSLAVSDIQNNERIIDIALKYGYASPTAFCRAFQNLHGVTPSEARKKGMSLKTYPPITFKLTITGTEELTYRIEDKPSIPIRGAAFTLIASAAIHDKKIAQDTLDLFLKLISENSNSEHEHIKKAVSWALREIGKIDFDFNEKALVVAHELLKTGNKTQIWIAKDTIKELENVTKTEGRKRLISVNSKMGQNL